ncbi:PREDICTED: coiled-coil domain-containing protein 13-like isoform X2 [Priapulus caudatus]|uniref:Coiled-coil domain-containing protein 13-like isoform X2 n=1 Tax=Priapulus caudatus TaxID=37621 RepID=A0ABM1E5H0_PRICU|nr:PREDICTED: coiled-coil domain-containing protein 13-like isoform X2 [Priapulus caudatus]
MNCAPSFGVHDDMKLNTVKPGASSVKLETNAFGSDVHVQQSNEVSLRELKDENGRLFRLLSEREYQLKQIQKQHEQNSTFDDAGGRAGDLAATKIVELSKKLREVNAQMEQERTRARQLAKKAKDLEEEVKSFQNAQGSKRPDLEITGAIHNRVQYSPSGETCTKATQERLQQLQTKVGDYRNQCETLKKDLKIVLKVLSSEMGEEMNMSNASSLLNSPSSWRGRSQQICTLRSKVAELKEKLSKQNNTSVDSSSSLEPENTAAVPSAADRHRNQLKKTEREQKELQKRATTELKALEDDYAQLKMKLDALKARNQVLGSEVKQTKSQMAVLVEKGCHDNELVDALMKQLGQLKQAVADGAELQATMREEQHAQLQDRRLGQQRDAAAAEQLRTLLAEREDRVKQLEAQLSEAKQGFSKKLASQCGELTSVSHIPLAVSRLSPAVNAVSPQNSSSRQGTPDSCRMAAPNQTQLVGEGVAADALMLECQQCSIVREAAATEQERLLQLVAAMQKRNDDAISRQMELQSALERERRKAAKVGGRGPGVAGTGRSPQVTPTRSSTTTTFRLEDLSTR